MGLAAIVLAGTGVALAETSATPATKTTVVSQASPAPSASPNPFNWRGRIRAYDFTRQNAYNGTNGTGKANQQSFNASIDLHGDYSFVGSGFNVGATYLYANPFNNCTSPVSHLGPPTNPNPNQCLPSQPGLQYDDTLPGFEMSTLYETYLQFKANQLFVKVGNMVSPGTQTWTPASDSRLKPSAYTGAYGTYAFNKQWTVELGDYWQWECRTCSAFDKYTLLTDPAKLADGSGPYPGTNGIPNYTVGPNQVNGVTNSGVAFGRIGFFGGSSMPLTANLSYWGFNNIANAVWLDAKYPIAGRAKAFVALQAGSEGNTGSSIIGKISSGVFGLQAGINVLPNMTLTAGFDTIPIKTDTLTIAGAPGTSTLNGGGVTCGANGQLALVKPNTAFTAYFPYFLPTGGTGQCYNNGNGTANVYYGGWASPYTDSYATDPLFTTSLTQGMVDRRSPGTSYKLQLTFTSDDRRFVSYVSQAWYDYNNGAYANGTYETDFDALYYFRPLPKSGPYHGFSFRYRYGNRSESPVFAGGNQPALFVYNRFQAQYDF
jgi:hypothetical protein